MDEDAAAFSARGAVLAAIDMMARFGMHREL
jgi:hypothetical protein